MKTEYNFSLFAPYNDEVQLLGCFNDWQPQNMEKNEEGYFELKVELEDGDHEYLFNVRTKSWFYEENEWKQVIDPYAVFLSRCEKNSLLKIRDGRKFIDNFEWKHDHCVLPENKDLIIYELHVNDFSGGEADSKIRGTFKDVIAKLDYLAEIGITAVELMPTKSFLGDYSWGYNPTHFFCVESTYGTTEDLKSLIDSCHEKGIRVFMDGIYNHANTENPLAQINHDYWFHHEPFDPDNSWGPEFNYENCDENLEIKPAWKYIGDVVEYWVKEFHIDGIRYDAAKHINNFDFLGWISEKAKNLAKDKHFYNVAEYFPEDPVVTNVDGPVDGCWHETFYHTLNSAICKGSVDFSQLKEVIDCRLRGFHSSTNVVNYLTSHDHIRMMVELGNNDIFHEHAFRRAKLGASILFTSLGLPMVWMGEEFGDYQPLSQDSSKIDWTLLENAANKNLLAHYKGLIKLRRENAALTSDNLDFIYENDNDQVIAYSRWNEHGAVVVVILNFSTNFYSNYNITNFPASGTWKEWTRDYELNIENETFSADLAELEALVLLKQ